MGDEHRRETTTVRLVDPTHDRLKTHNREGETLSGTVGRALDALEREADLPDAVTLVMERSEPKECGEVHPLPCGVDKLCPETEADDG